MAETRVMGWVDNMKEPKRQNRYEVLIPDLDDDLRLACNSISLPTIDVDSKEIHRMHNLYKVAGAKVKYGDITVKFYDFVDNKVGKSLDEWHRLVYNIDSSLMGFPSDYKKNCEIIMYGPDHSIVEQWVLVGAWPKSVKRASGLDWKNEGDPIEIELTLAIDEAKIVLT